MSKNIPKVLLEGVITPVMDVNFIAVDGDKPLSGLTNMQDKIIADHNKIAFSVDTSNVEFQTFLDKIEEFGVLSSVSDLKVDKKIVKGKKKLTIKTFKVKDLSSLSVVMADGTPVTDKYFDTRVDKITAQAVVKAILYENFNTLSLELEAVILHTVEKGERETATDMSDAAAQIVADLQTRSNMLA